MKNLFAFFLAAFLCGNAFALTDNAALNAIATNTGGPVSITNNGLDPIGVNILAGGLASGLGVTDLATQRVVLAYDQPDLNVKSPGTPFAHIATNTTTLVRSGFTVLHGITVNTSGTGASTITVYNNTAGSGAVVAVIDSATSRGTYKYDVALSTGLTIVTTGTTTPDITVSYH